MSKTLSIKIPQIARWRIAGVPDVKIASLLGMSPGGLARITSLPEYKEYEAALLNGHLSKMDEALAGKIAAIRHEFKTAVPAAMRCLVDAVTQRRDLRAALEAAKEILDRDPDRALVKSKDDQVVPGLPTEVLDLAAAEGNAVATKLQDDAKKAVN